METKYRYSATVNLISLGCFSSLHQAIKALWDKVKDSITLGQMSIQELETCAWIEENGSYLMDFYTARDYAITNGWVVDGEWVILPKTEKEL